MTFEQVLHSYLKTSAPLTERELARALSADPDAVSAICSLLYAKGKLGREGKGRPKNPYRYYAKGAV